MKSSSFIQGAAFDAGSLDTLKRLAKQDAQRGLQGAAQQMEGLFVQMMLKSMRAASFKDSLFNSQQSEMFTAMYDQQLAQDMAAHGKLGLADAMVQQLGGAPMAATGGTASAFSSRQLPTGRIAFPTPSATMAIAGKQPQPLASGGGFVTRLLAPAVEVSRQTGIPHQLIIAQAALESGWGEKEIRQENGQPSYNLFGIKATPGWKGKTAEITTTEYINGVAKKVKAAFRVYQSYSDALKDYGETLVNNSRYQNVISAETPEQAAKALQDGGYATDPQYAKKLISIMQQIKNNLTKSASAYKVDLSSIF